MEHEDYVDLRHYLGVVRRRFWVLVVIILAATVTSGVISLYFLEPAYQASTTLMVVKKESPLTDYTSLLLNRNLVKTYGEIAKSRTVTERVVRDLGLGIRPEDLQSRIDVNMVRDTEIIRLNVTSPLPKEASVTANALAVAFIQRVGSIMKVENVEVIDPAVEPVRPVRPRPLLNVAVAAVLGVFTGFGLIFLLEYLDNTIKTAEDVGRYLELPVLATIPSIDLKLEAKRRRPPGAEAAAQNAQAHAAG